MPKFSKKAARLIAELKELNQNTKGNVGETKKNVGERIKYNWPDEKTEFFESDFTEIKAYFRFKYNAYNPHIQRKTAGWTLEKKLWRKDQSDRLLAEIADNRVKVASRALNKLLKIVVDDVDNLEANRRTFTQEPASTLWRIIRTEAGLPSSITKQENIDLNELDDARRLLDEKLNNEKKPISKPGKSVKGLPRPGVARKSKP